MGNMMSGMAWGAGMSMANRAVDSVIGPRQVEVHHTGQPEGVQSAGQPGAAARQPQQVCGTEMEWMKQCLEHQMTAPGGDMSNCQTYADILKQCQINQGGGAAPAA